MKPTTKRWLIREQNPELSQKISQSLNISALVAQTLINRGVFTLEQADFFLNSSLKDLHSPFFMKDMDRAVRRIITAVFNREKICVYGDYDADGVTATAALILFLREMQGDVYFYIPNRLNEGYGLNQEALQKIKKQGTTLIVTVDCGVSDFDPILFANSQKIDVIVIDHHEVPEKKPPAYAILNPKQPDCRFPFKQLAGVGVAFNLLMALRKNLREIGFWNQRQTPNLKNYLDLVALGTIADIAPMIDENRILVKAGLEVLSNGHRIGIQALKKVSALENIPITSSMVAFRLAPRINAAGRIGIAEDGVRLLISKNYEEALSLAKNINEENIRRQQIEKTILAEAKAMIEEEAKLLKPLILSSAKWHSGVIGVCASRLVEEYYLPTILIAMNKKTGEGKGSARSIPGFDLYKGLKKCASLLKAFGGHKHAAGLTVAQNNMASFMERFERIFREELQAEDLIPRIEIDAQISLASISFDVLEEIEKLAPFGPSNPEPIFSSYDIQFYSSMIVGNGHLKLKIKEGGCFYDAIGFNMGSQHNNLKNDKICLAFVPQFNLWQGVQNIQLKLKDIKGIP